MTIIFSVVALHTMQEKQRQLNRCDPKIAFEYALKEAQKTWRHNTKQKQQNKFW